LVSKKRILLIYPQHPDTFWSFRHVLKFISKKAAFPPLGLLTVASMLPPAWEKKLVDMNVSPLKNEDIIWADYVLIGAMIIQKDSARDVIARCREFEKTLIAGGPLFTTGFEEFEGIDHCVRGEAENIIPKLVEDLEKGCAQPLYEAQEFPDIKSTPIPLWDLIDLKDYAIMSVQYSRGCPFDCEFCDIIVMNGHVPRTKGKEQLIDELEALYMRGWRGQVFIVDDNFIGNRVRVKEAIREIIHWNSKRRHPFLFLTEASINLADDEELMELMAAAGFQRVFVGIETPVEESLQECNKIQNRGSDLAEKVRKIQLHGMEVIGGFIVGFDSDPPSIFEKQIDLIQKSGVVTAMVGILNAFPGTRLHKRLKEEKRLVDGSTGNNVSPLINFLPRMESHRLIEGYRAIIRTIYSPREYYERIITFLKEYRPAHVPRIRWTEMKAVIKSFWFIGVVGEARKYYWKLLSWTLLKRPRALSLAVAMAICGIHLQKVADEILSCMPGIPRQENLRMESAIGNGEYDGIAEMKSSPFQQHLN
jgi:radical SAM superfamily enzyme YgiQ (UPF0313 family)